MCFHAFALLVCFFFGDRKNGVLWLVRAPPSGQNVVTLGLWHCQHKIATHNIAMHKWCY